MIIRGSGVTDDNPVIGWHNIVTTSNIVATTEDANFPATNLANPSTHLKWRNGANSPAGNDYLTVSGFAQTISYVAFARHNFGTEAFTLTVQVQNASSPTAWDTVVPATLITDDTPLIFQFAPRTDATGLRVLLTGDGIGNAEAAVMYVGNILTLDRSVRIDINPTPINFGTVSNIMSGMSESGQFVGRIVRNQYQESKMDFWYLTDDFIRTSGALFVRSAVDNPFFVAWAPADSPAGYPTDTGFCWLIKDPKPEMHLPTRRWIVSLEMRGIS